MIPNIPSFIQTNARAITPYGGIPHFVQATGVLPGQTPVIGGIATPGRVNVKALAESINRAFIVNH